MRARELAVEYPTVTPDDRALDAARLLAEHGLPALVVVDARGRPVAVLPGSRLLRRLIPRYVRDDPNLAHVYDEEHADRLGARLAEQTVADLLRDDESPLPVVDGDATVMEIACVMDQARSPVVAVRERGGEAMIGAVAVPRLLTRLLPGD